MESAIRIENVSKIIGRKKILRNVSFDACKGEIIGLIGHNGAGKTTLMKIICGLSSRTSGEIIVNGVRTTKTGNEQCKKMGALIEQAGLYNEFSGYKNLRLMSYYYENVSIREIITLLDYVGLKDVMYQKVKTYSLGMKQRLGIAMALLNEPEILILDEPFNGLDIDAVRDLRAFFEYLSTKKGVTIIISSHILDELDKICDRGVFINKGEIVGIVDKQTMITQGFEETYVQIMGKEVRKYGNY